jgi:hypothetical protein
MQPINNNISLKRLACFGYNTAIIRTVQHIDQVVAGGLYKTINVF